MKQEFDRNNFKEFAINNKPLEKQSCEFNHSELVKAFYPNVKFENSFRVIGDEELKSYSLIGSLKDNNIKHLNYIEFNNREGELNDINSVIATNFYPYHNCDVYKCKGCGRLFLVYTEYSGHSPQLRIRNVKSELIVEEPSIISINIEEKDVAKLLTFLNLDEQEFYRILEDNKHLERVNTNFESNQIIVKKVNTNNDYLIVAKRETIYGILKILG